MDLHYGLDVNEKGRLTISGCDTVELAQKYGTPLYVIDEDFMRKNCAEFIKAADKYFDRCRVMYASKALNTKAILKIADSEGLGIDVVSGGELYTALSAGIDPQKIELHGNSKTYDEVKMAVENQIFSIIADGMDELELIDEVCAELNKQIKVSLRLRPNIDVHAHSAVQTAKMDCKFGFGLSDGQAMAGVKRVLKSDYMILHGIHCHIGSQIFDEDPFRSLIEHFGEFAVQVREETGAIFSDFNCGGGYGVRYNSSDTPKPFGVFLKLMAEAFEKFCKGADYPMPTVTIEPGRSVIGEAGTTLYTVNGVKEITGVRTYCMCDGGMFENIRTALYEAEYDAVCASKMNEPHVKKAAIAGKCCESGDMITWNTPLPESLKRGDTLAVFTTGAYNYSMASNYNRNPVPAMVLVNKGTDRLIVKRQTYEYILMNDVLD